MTSSFVFPPPSQVFVPVSGDARVFAVRRVFCVGRNFAEHAKEMGADARTPPFFFMKPADALVLTGRVPYPSETADFQHEVEPVVAIGRRTAQVEPEAAWDAIWAYGVGLDMTRRDLQAKAKAAGHPWDMSKGFDASAPISELVTVSALGGHPRRGLIALDVNGQRRQTGDIQDLIWSAAETVAHLSRLVVLEAGDLIFLGTPAGVAPVVPGDVLSAQFEGVSRLEVAVTGR